MRCITDAFQILAITLDNASNNNTLIEELPDLLEGFQGSLTRIHCLAHILNLVVSSLGICSYVYIVYEAILSRFAKEKASTSEDEDEDEDDEEADVELVKGEVVDGDENDEVDPAVKASDQSVVEEIVRELNSEEVDDDDGAGELRQLTDEEALLGQTSLSKVREPV
jgi:hypothetical protein